MRFTTEKLKTSNKMFCISFLYEEWILYGDINNIATQLQELSLLWLEKYIVILRELKWREIK